MWRARRVPFICACGPMLNAEIHVSVGESVVRDHFVFADLIAC
jgi:hypothetical protein